MPCASLSLDLDNQWCFMQTNGDPGWEAYPSYLDAVVPRILEFFRKRDTRITVFVVGQDAALESNAGALASIAAAGHEIGNHSFRHQPWLHEYQVDELNEELDKSESAIEAATGVRPVAFRGPGYSYSADTLRVLSRRGYQFDASSFPNAVNVLARMYFFRGSKLGAEEKLRRKALFGRPSEVFRPIRPYLWDVTGSPLLEIPVTTLPLLRLPIHFSYVLYLGKRAPWLARAYFRLATSLCKWFGVEPSMLFHPLDFMGKDDGCDAVSFFPGMNMHSSDKIRLLNECLDILLSDFELVPMSTHAERIRQRSHLRVLPMPAEQAR